MVYYNYRKIESINYAKALIVRSNGNSLKLVAFFYITDF